MVSTSEIGGPHPGLRFNELQRVLAGRLQEGHKDNVKRVYRLYREEGLSLRLKRPERNKAAKLRQPKQLAHAINEIIVSIHDTAHNHSCPGFMQTFLR